MFSWPNSRAYGFTSLALWLTFLGAVVAYSYGREAAWPVEALIVLALIPAATVAAQFFLALKLFEKQDEFVRALTAKRMIGAAGLTIMLVTGWGSLQGVTTLPTLPLWLIYPLFWSLFAMVTPFIKGTNA